MWTQYLLRYDCTLRWTYNHLRYGGQSFLTVKWSFYTPWAWFASLGFKRWHTSISCRPCNLAYKGPWRFLTLGKLQKVNRPSGFLLTFTEWITSRSKLEERDKWSPTVLVSLFLADGKKSLKQFVDDCRRNERHCHKSVNQYTISYLFAYYSTQLGGGGAFKSILPMYVN